MEKTALFIGCGLGSGFLRPGPGTWGSGVGLLYTAALLKLPLQAAVLVGVLGLALSAWSSAVCERLFGRKDPGEVVIDEIVCIPIALWPLFILPHPPLWIWLAGFVIFRVLDISKPFPIKQLQGIPGGLGILIDDVVAAMLTSALVWAVLRIG